MNEINSWEAWLVLFEGEEKDLRQAIRWAMLNQSTWLLWVLENKRKSKDALKMYKDFMSFPAEEIEIITSSYLVAEIAKIEPGAPAGGGEAFLQWITLQGWDTARKAGNPPKHIGKERMKELVGQL